MIGASTSGVGSVTLPPTRSGVPSVLVTVPPAIDPPLPSFSSTPRAVSFTSTVRPVLSYVPVSSTVALDVVTRSSTSRFDCPDN
jgi:hypothetical protein